MRFSRATVALGVLTLGLFAALETGCVCPEGEAPGRLARADRPTGTVSIADDELARMGLRAYWSNKLALVGDDSVSQVRLLEGNLVILTRNNLVYVVDGADGRQRPLAKIAPESSGEFTAPTFDGTRYFFAGSSSLIGVNAATGVADVKISLDMPTSTLAHSDRECVYVGALDGRVFVYSTASQVKKWNSKVGPGVTSLAFARDQLIIARSDLKKGRGEILSVRPNDWREIWNQFTDGAILAPIACGGTPETVFVACMNGSLYCFSAEHGWPVWQMRTPSPLTDPPLLLAKAVVQHVPGIGTWLASRTRGEPIWKDPAKLDYLGQSADRMYFFDGAKLICKNAATGETLSVATVANARNVLTVPNPDQSKLYFVDRAGNILCCNDVGQPYFVIDR